MSIATMPRLSESLQALVDLRLDTIDRMLLGRVSRQERLAIVGEVEAQIHERLSELDSDEPSREDLLAVLSRLDPPEAYVPEGTEPNISRAFDSPVMSRADSRAPTAEIDPRIGKAAGILGLVAIAFLFLMPLIYVGAAVTGSEEILLIGLFLAATAMFLCGLLGAAFGIYARFRGAGPVIGVIAGALAVMNFVAGGLLFLATA